ncbi:hypothetical protein AB0N31_27635 [Streptomyces sp. NPDC051051]
MPGPTARRTCQRDAGYVIPAALGTYVPCAYPDPHGSEGNT